MAPIKFGVGQSVPRKEDDALIRGRGRYTADSRHSRRCMRSCCAHRTHTRSISLRRSGLAFLPLALAGERAQWYSIEAYT
jgi:carbon-monoxide dehydrogenase large subunit